MGQYRYKPGNRLPNKKEGAGAGLKDVGKFKF